MNYSSFCDYLLASLKNHLGPNVTITKEAIRKNNSVILDAFIIHLPACASSPVVYLMPLYQNYKNGSTIEQLASIVAARLKKEAPLSGDLIESARSFDKARNRIVYRLISQKNNEALLKDVPWIPFLDLAIVFYLHLGVRDDKQISSVIHNRLAKSWNISTAELYRLAEQNTPKLCPCSISLLEHLLLGLDPDISEDMLFHDTGLPPLYVLTNKTGINGAACILYQDIIKDFAERIGSDLIILPSSIHEVLLFPDSHDQEYIYFRDMIQNVNAEDVAEEDILSDELYLYHRGDPEIRLWIPCESDNTPTCGTGSL